MTITSRTLSITITLVTPIPISNNITGSRNYILKAFVPKLELSRAPNDIRDYNLLCQLSMNQVEEINSKISCDF